MWHRMCMPSLGGLWLILAAAGPPQAYRAWLNSSHEWLFYVNNDVLIPDGVIDILTRAMTPEGAPLA